MSIESMFQEVQKKINELNSGLLNSNDVPSHYSAKQCTELGLLSFELESSISRFNRTDKNESDVRSILNQVNDIEKRAIHII